MFCDFNFVRDIGKGSNKIEISAEKDILFSDDMSEIPFKVMIALLFLLPLLGESRRHLGRRRHSRLSRKAGRNEIKEMPLPKFDWEKSKAKSDAGLTAEQKQRLELLRLVGLDGLRAFFDIPVL